nr:MAG TPA: hypothetical protein [Caudoviricetes sp.]
MYVPINNKKSHQVLLKLNDSFTNLWLLYKNHLFRN